MIMRTTPNVPDSIIAMKYRALQLSDPKFYLGNIDKIRNILK